LEGNYTEANAYLEQAATILADYAVPFGEMHLNLSAHRGLLQIRLGNAEAAIATLRETLDRAEGLPSTSVSAYIRARTHNWYGVALGYLGRYSESLSNYQAAVVIADQIGEKRLAGTFTLNTADEYFAMGDLEQAMVYAMRGEQIARQVGEMDDLSYARSSREPYTWRWGRLTKRQKS
jgi:tetratricopeptide (TPR) repeat protein